MKILKDIYIKNKLLFKLKKKMREIKNYNLIKLN